MIKLLKKVSFCGSSLLKTASFSFASKSSVEFHKAVLASRIISIIRKSPLNEFQSESFPSLKETILEEISNYEAKKKSGADENLIKQAAKEVRNCFEDGVYVPYYMCSQNRNTEKIKQYQQITNEKGQIEILNVKETDQNQMSDIQFRKLSFVPTYIITGQIFRSIFEEQNCNLLTGQYGVGKTYSFVLYKLLSEMIFRYRHQERCSGNHDLPEEINFQIPKAVYLSMNPSQISIQLKDYELKIKKIFQYQCYQLKDIWKKYNIFTLSTGLFDQYSKFGISTIFLNDQINEAASALRRLKQYQLLIQEIKSKIIKIEKQQQDGRTLTQKQKNQILDLIQQKNKARKNYNEVWKAYQKAMNYLSILNGLISQRNFNRFLYLSSVDIEKNLLDDLKLLGDSKQASIHSRIIRLDYPIALSGNIAIADTCEFIVLHLKSYWKKIQMNENPNKTQLPQEQQQMLQNIKKKLNAAMREKQYNLVIPHKIKQLISQLQSKKASENRITPSLNSISLTFQSFRQCDQTQLNQKLHELIEKLQDSSIYSMQIKFSQFLKKENTNKKLTHLKSLFSFRLWSVAENALKNNQFIKHEQKMDKNQNGIIGLRSSIYVNAKQYKDLLQHHEYKNILSQLFFTYVGSYLQIKLNPLVIRRSFDANRKFILEELLSGSNPLFDYVNGNRGVLGTFLQNIITTMLKKGQTNFQYTLKSTRTPKNYHQIHQTSSCFIPIPKVNEGSYDDYYFLNSFETHFETLQNKNIQPKRIISWNLLLPLIVPSSLKKPDNKVLLNKFLQDIIQRGIRDNQIDIRSKLIDFSLCKILSQFKIVQIDLFDVTANQEFMDKIYDFLVEFMYFKDRNKQECRIKAQEYKINLTYNVITTEDYNNDFVKLFNEKIKSLERKTNLQQSSLNLVKALKSFTFKNEQGGCRLMSKKTRKREEFFCLKKINIISLKNDEITFKNSTNQNQIQLDIRMLKRVIEELRK